MKLKAEQIRYASVDYLAANMGWLVFNMLRYTTLPTAYTSFMTLGDFLGYKTVLWGQLAVPLAIVALFALFGSYNRSHILWKSRIDEVVTAFIVSAISTLGIFFTVLIDDSVPERVSNYELLVILLLCLFIPVAVLRLVYTSKYARKLRMSDGGIRTLVLGLSEPSLPRLRELMEDTPATGLQVAGCAGVAGIDEKDIPVKTFKDRDIAGICRDHNIEAVVLLYEDHAAESKPETLEMLFSLGIPVFVIANLRSLMTMRPKVQQVTSLPLVDITRANISPALVNIKRLSDIIVSALALVALVPVYAAAACVIKFTSPGPVFYTQERIGYRKKPFKIIKFRTMHVDAEPNGPQLAGDNDPRITRVGRFMRRYRVDELPQFWNVLKGEMSLVGPRPERRFFIDQIVQRVPAYTLIHQVRPGITSWGAVKYGYATSLEQMLSRLAYDLLYIENISLGVDLKIMFHTVNTVLRGRGK